MEGKINVKKSADFDVSGPDVHLANTLTTCTTHVSFPFGSWYIIGKDYIYSFAFVV